VELSKKQIKRDVLKLLEESGIEKPLWEKILNKFVNYTYSTHREKLNREPTE
jgi:hypothetical protein